MKPVLRLALAAAILAAPASGCSSLGKAPTADTLQLRESQALYVAEAAFKGCSIALDAAAGSGLLKADQAAKARAAYEKAHAALLAARAAKQAGDEALAATKAAEAITQAGQVQQIAGANPQS